MGVCTYSLSTEMLLDVSDSALTSSEGETKRKIPFLCPSLSPSFCIFLPCWSFSAFLTLYVVLIFLATSSPLQRFFALPSLAGSSWGPFTLAQQQISEGPGFCTLIIRHPWPRRGLTQCPASTLITGRRQVREGEGKRRDRPFLERSQATMLPSLVRVRDYPGLNTLVNVIAFFQVCRSLVTCPRVGH